MTTRFAELRHSGRKALIPYITAGDPKPGLTVPLMHALVRAGADVFELGVPFSDPMADGPVIQQACERALAAGMTLRPVFDLVRMYRTAEDMTPVGLMGYLNPIETLGYAAFAGAAREAGVDGVLTVDLPPEEARGLVEELTHCGLAPIFLLAPTSTTERIARVTALARGFIYYVSLKGVTGAANLALDSVAAKLAELRAYTDLPIGVGFGVRDAATARAVGELADAVIVGSALVRRLGEWAAAPERMLIEVSSALAAMRQALDAVSEPTLRAAP